MRYGVSNADDGDVNVGTVRRDAGNRDGGKKRPGLSLSDDLLDSQLARHGLASYCFAPRSRCPPGLVVPHGKESCSHSIPVAPRSVNPNPHLGLAVSRVRRRCRSESTSVFGSPRDSIVLAVNRTLLLHRHDLSLNAMANYATNRGYIVGFYRHASKRRVLAILLFLRPPGEVFQPKPMATAEDSCDAGDPGIAGPSAANRV
jgi:hypothetical protein